MKKINHVTTCWEEISKCKTTSNVEELFKDFDTNLVGEWKVESIPGGFKVTNTFGCNAVEKVFFENDLDNLKENVRNVLYKFLDLGWKLEYADNISIHLKQTSSQSDSIEYHISILVVNRAYSMYKVVSFDKFPAYLDFKEHQLLVELLSLKELEEGKITNE